jgi:hypothetical protein
MLQAHVAQAQAAKIQVESQRWAQQAEQDRMKLAAIAAQVALPLLSPKEERREKIGRRMEEGRRWKGKGKEGRMIAGVGKKEGRRKEEGRKEGGRRKEEERRRAYQLDQGNSRKSLTRAKPTLGHMSHSLGGC